MQTYHFQFEIKTMHKGNLKDVLFQRFKNGLCEAIGTLFCTSYESTRSGFRMLET